MRRTLFALAVAFAGVASIGAPAQAYCVGCAVGAGAIGGLAAAEAARISGMDDMSARFRESGAQIYVPKA